MQMIPHMRAAVIQSVTLPFALDISNRWWFFHCSVSWTLS
jgi:hypothetical protein